MTRSTGAQAVCGALEALGVRHVFAYPGTEISDLLEGLRSSGLRTVVPTSENGGTFMAAGQARATGQPGVAAVIPGPGLAYALPGLAEARYDSLPLLVLTGVNDAHAPFDLGDAVRPVSKAVLEPGWANDLAAAVAEGYRLAASGEPGPVVVRLPPAALAAPASPPAFDAEERAKSPAEAAKAAAAVAERLTAAGRVTLLFGQGAAGAGAEAVELAERLGAAVLTTTSGRGVVPESHPRALAADIPGHGSEQLNRLVHDSGAVLALGCRFNRNATLGDRLVLDPAQLVHVDAAPAADPVRPAGLTVAADVPAFMRALLAALPSDAQLGWEIGELESRRAELERVRAAAGRGEPSFVELASPEPSAFFGALRRALPEEGILAVDSGLHQQLARRYFEVLRPRTFLLPSDFQSMGFAIPAAIGAALARPGLPVVALLGDGGLAISGLELLTAARESLPLTVVVLNDGRLNLIRVQQLLRFGREHATTVAPPDVEALAAATGARYMRVAGDPEPLLAESVASQELRLLEVVLEDSTWLRRLAAVGTVRRAARRGRARLRL